jgi:membrane-associated phospholipid phosphatase
VPPVVSHRKGSKVTQIIGIRLPATRQAGLTITSAVALICLILSAVVARFGRHEFDYPVSLFFNHFVNRSDVFDHVASTLTGSNLPNGVVLMAGIWLAWFDRSDAHSRAKVAAGVIAASLSGVVSRAMQIVLPTTPRPINDAAFSFVHLRGIEIETVRVWNSFPSDHSSLLFALGMVIFLVRPSIGIAALAWALLINLFRVYIGLHYLSDIVGGAALGIASVCLSQYPAIQRRSLVFPRWATRRAGLFYAAAFLVTYLVATLFDELRSIPHGVAALFR